MGRIRNALRALRGAPLPQPIRGSSFLWQMPGSFDTRPIRTKQQQSDAYLGWVYAAASLLAQDIRANPWFILDKEGNAVENTQAETVMRRPFPFSTWGDLIEVTQLNLDLVGEAFWWLIGGERITGIQHIPAAWVTEPILRDGQFLGWTVQIPGHAPRTLSARDLVWFHNPHPYNPWAGMSPVEAFALSFNMDIYARAYGAALMQNWAQPPGILTTEQDVTPEEADALRSRWREQRQNAESIAVLGKGAKYEPLSISVKDLAFIDLARMTREQILGIYRVPPGKLGLAEEGGTQAEHSARDNAYAKNALLPRMHRIEDTINTFVLPRLLIGNAVVGTLRFEFENPVQKDLTFELLKAEQGIARGVITVNEYLIETGRDELPGPEGDLYMLPTGVTLVAKLEDGLSTQIQPAPLGDEEDEESDDVEDVEEDDTEDPPGRATRGRWLPEGLIPGLTTRDMDEAEARYLSRQGRIERKMQGNLNRILTRERTALVEAVKAGELRSATTELRYEDGELGNAMVWEGRDLIDDILKRYTPQWLKALRDATHAGIRDGWNLLRERTSKELLSFELFDAQAQSYAAANAAKKVADISKETQKQVRKVIANNIAEGGSVERLAVQITDLYDGWADYRTERIARTETATAVNRGSHEHATAIEQRLDLVVYDTWLATHDDLVREHHADANGQRIRHGEYFNVANESGAIEFLLHPGDNENGASASNVVNCRCTTVSEVFERSEVQ